MRILRATAADARELLELQKAAFQIEAELYNDFTIAPLTETLTDLEREFTVKTILKAMEGNRIVGAVRACEKGETVYIGRLCAAPNVQNRGIGTGLMKEIELLFNGCERYELFTGGRSGKNLHFYEKLGYRIFKMEQLNDRVSFVYMAKEPEPRGA